MNAAARKAPTNIGAAEGDTWGWAVPGGNLARQLWLGAGAAVCWLAKKVPPIPARASICPCICPHKFEMLHFFNSRLTGEYGPTLEPVRTHHLMQLTEIHL
jgi:hypothetical protein